MHPGTPRCVSSELLSHRRTSAAVRRAARPGPADAIGLGHGVRGNLQGKRTRASHAPERSFAFDAFALRAFVSSRRRCTRERLGTATIGATRRFSFARAWQSATDASVEPSVDRSPCSNTTIATFVGPVRSREFRNSRTRTGHTSRASDSRAARGWRSGATGCRPTTRKHACFRATPLAAGPDSARIAAHDAYPSQTVYK